MKKIESLLYISLGNLPSKMAHTVQIAKMAQSLSQKVEDFSLLTSGDIVSAFKGMDSEFKNWYGLTQQFNVVRLPVQLHAKYPFPQNYYSQKYFKLAALYACLKSPSFVYTRSNPIVASLLKIGIPVLWERHDLLEENLEPDSLYHQFINSKNAVGLITLSSDLAESYINNGFDPEKILIAHSGVDLSNFQADLSKDVARKMRSLPQQAKIVLYSGHLYDYKGIPTLIETAALLPEYQFVLVGGWQQDIDRAQIACQQKNIDNVRFIGHVSQTELATYLYAADILILPTSKKWNLSSTTSPLKLFDYMAAKRPIVASALPNIMTVLRDGENALLVEPDEPAAFKQAIVNLLENPSLANSLVQCAAKEVKNYTWDRRTDLILKFAAERLEKMSLNIDNFSQNRLKYLKNMLK